MTGAPHPRMHGGHHVPGGPDPIPGLMVGDSFHGVVGATRPGGYWKMGETTGDWNDSSNNGRDMTYVSRGETRGTFTDLDEGEHSGVDDFPGLGVAVAGGAPASAKSPSNIGEISDGSFFAFAGTAPMTVSAYVELLTVPGGAFSGGICGNVNVAGPPPSTAGWGLYVESTVASSDGEGSRVIFRRRSSSGTTASIVSGETLVDDPNGVSGGPYYSFVRVTATYDGAESALYIGDGLQGVNANTVALPSAASNETFRVGDCGIAEGVGGTMAPFNGIIDSVIVWDRALTGSEIAAIVNAGQSGLVPTSDGDGGTTWAAPTIEVQY